MKRRDLILASAGLVLPSLGRGAQPCPPPLVGAAGGSSATTDCPTVPTPPPDPTGTSISTNFPATENPISEGGRWINGKSVGLGWNNVRTSPGKAHAAQFVGLSGNRYDDCLAHLNTSFTPNQYAQGTVHRVAGYRNSTDKHEIELLLRFRITANSARGYEVLWGQDGEIWVVRWNGPLGNYTAFEASALPNSDANKAVDGDVLRAEISGNIITVKRNGLTVVRQDVTALGGTTWTDGQPGVGFWPTAGSTLDAYGWKNYQAGSL